MKHEDYKQQFTAWAQLTEARLAELCDTYLPQQSALGQAARYSLLGGGKRVRAVLTLAACQLCGADAAAFIPDRRNRRKTVRVRTAVKKRPNPRRSESSSNWRIQARSAAAPAA